jgi:hypothetical protein
MFGKSVAHLIIAAAFAVPAMAEQGSMGEPKMLIHGNYCGPGNNSPLPPIDALDAACKRHDACTPDGSMPSHACNARLESEADAISRDEKYPSGLRTLAAMIASGAEMLQLAAAVEPVPARVGIRQLPVGRR